MNSTATPDPVDEQPWVGRFNAATAPDGLRLVQELLNTATPPARTDRPDLLATRDAATAWLQALGMPAGEVDNAALCRLRDGLRAALVRRDEDGEVTAGDPDLLETRIRFRLSSDGVVRTTEASRGTDAVRDKVLLALHDAQLSGTWARLKVCRNPDCRVAFWDNSRNTSAVWHDARSCGNMINLRASRARRQRRGTEASG